MTPLNVYFLKVNFLWHLLQTVYHPTLAKFICWNLIPSVMAFKGTLGHEDGPLRE